MRTRRRCIAGTEIYVDAYEWVELPNVVGMSQFADGGIIASKPYVSSGAYINRMSDYCGYCRYDVKQRVGEDACPFNALYWDFWRGMRSASATIRAWRCRTATGTGWMRRIRRRFGRRRRGF